MSQTYTPLVHAAMRPGPWAMHKPMLQQLPAQLALRLQQLRMDTGDIQAAVTASAGRSLGQIVGSVGVIPIRNCITYRFDFWTWIMDGTATEQIRPAFRQLLADPAISTIVFDIDSPGGEVCDVPELADEIFAARGTKKLIAVCNPLMASAAEWIGAACDEVVMPPSGFIGSVGCYTMHEDLSALLERIGVKVTFIQHGEHKTEGNAYEPLSDDAHEDMQASVNYFGAWFEKALAKFYGITAKQVQETFGQGRVLRAPEAKKVGMVHRIATFDEVMAKLTMKRGGGTRAAAEDVPVPVAEPAQVEIVPVAADDDGVDPLEDGSCPEGYENGGDGRCYLPADDKDEEASARARADQDAIAATLALTE